MPLILNAQNLTKSHGLQPLFTGVSFTVSDGDRIGLIGPNGAGKSTLIDILTGHREADSGEVAMRKGARRVSVHQNPSFPPGATVASIVGQPAGENAGAASTLEWLGRGGFLDPQARADTFSGGWLKRLAIVEALVQNPDLLLLDEPTNHLDLAGIDWLEKLLESAPFASVIVSHDRYFLENVATQVMELNRAYPAGLFRAAGNYSTFLEKKGDYLHAQNKRQEALENRVRIEMDWLRRGPKARTTKSKARIAKANELIGELSDLESRARTATAGIDFNATERKTKRLIELEGVSCQLGGRTLFENLDFVLTPGTRAGLVGPNGSGKTTLMRMMMNEMEPAAGTVRRADQLRMVYFDQKRVLDPELSLRRALAPDGDSVIYRGRVLHVASWAARFLFTSEQLVQPVGRLSGGERARVLIARLMLEPADVLLLDEPTNDLDIPTLEILEESLIEFPGALVLITHDRYLLDRVSTTVLGLDGSGGAGHFADFTQWDMWQQERRKARDRQQQPAPSAAPAPASKKKLSYLDARDYETIEQRVDEAERTLGACRGALEDPAISSDPHSLQKAIGALQQAQLLVDQLYERWAELEQKRG